MITPPIVIPSIRATQGTLDIPARERLLKTWLDGYDTNYLRIAKQYNKRYSNYRRYSGSKVVDNYTFRQLL